MIDPTRDIRDSMIPIIDVLFLTVFSCKSKDLQYLFSDSNIHSFCRSTDTMSESLAQQPIWTPPVIATIVYRVVMIIVSIAFIWKKYRQPKRQLDGNSALPTLTPHSSLLTLLFSLITSLRKTSVHVHESSILFPSIRTTNH
jgi:hypothetical protein